MEIRTDFTALVLPTPAELQIAAERARIASEASPRPSREGSRRWFAGRGSAPAATRHAVAR